MTSPAGHASTEAGCFHCGLPLPAGRPWTAWVDDRHEPVCCPGCKAVAEAIAQGGLSSYYRSRTAYAARAGPAEHADLAIYDRPEVQAGFVRSSGASERETTLIIEGIVCAACVWLNEKHLGTLPGVLSVHINYTTRRAQVRWDDSRIKLSTILAQVEAIGYRAWPATSANAEQARRNETRAALWRLFVAGFGMMQVMMYALPAYLADDGSMSEDVGLLMRLASLVLTVPVVFFSAAPFFRGAWRDLRRRRAGMDVPVALGIGAAFAASLYATFSGGSQVYYDSITMFVFFLLCARWLEMRARQKAAASLEYLDKALPLVAHRLRDSGHDAQTEEVPAISLRAGDRVLVRAGEGFPADGDVVDGDTECDESLLTGESIPVRKRAGDRVNAGSFNRLSPVVVHVTRVGEDTCASGVRRLAERAGMLRPGIAEVAGKVASRFVIGVLLLAVASALVWLWIDPSRALWVAVTVLVVSCPCALSLAAPAAMTVAVGRLARHGVVIVRGHAIEALAGVTHVVFDKTGTLTEGRFSLVACLPQQGVEAARARALAGALERGSEHPIAAAFADAADAGVIAARDLVNVPGAGIEASMDGVRHRLGTQSFVAGIAGTMPFTPSDHPGATRVWLGREGAWLACFDLVDRLRPQAQSVVRQLQAGGRQVLIWSGDAAPVVGTVAGQLGVDGYDAGLLPEDKLSRMLSLQQQGAVVAMVGDGVNDAPVLAQAQLSIAMGSGALLAQEHADIVLLSGRLQGLVEAIAIAARARRIVRQNLAWASAYNAVALSLAAAGLVTPWMAGIGMGASSLFVVLNALRVRGGAQRDSRAGPRAEERGPSKSNQDSLPSRPSLLGPRT